MNHRLDTVSGIIGVLTHFPANGKLNTSEDIHQFNAVTHGFVEHVEEKQQCGACGARKAVYEYYRITEAGRLLLALALAGEE
jgi:hypothetical protein